MTPENFAYWLQGFVELHGAPPSAEQWEQIKAHLNLVFEKITPIPSNPMRIGEPFRPHTDQSIVNLQCQVCITEYPIGCCLMQSYLKLAKVNLSGLL